MYVAKQVSWVILIVFLSGFCSAGDDGLANTPQRVVEVVRALEETQDRVFDWLDWFICMAVNAQSVEPVRQWSSENESNSSERD